MLKPFAKSCFALVLIASNAGAVFGKEPTPSITQETPKQRDARMDWFRNAKFGMFIHWTTFSVPAGEWNGKAKYHFALLKQTNMPLSEYEKFRDQFNPVKFDAKKWVATAKNAGCKYIVITSKHHDGFCMFDTKLTDWGIAHSPFKRDPIKELSQACKKAGIKFCVYYSILDWHHPDYAPRLPGNDIAKGEPDYDRYVGFMKGQLKELLTNYGPIGILWFDGEWEKTWTQERGKDLYAYCRSLQPNIIVNNRVGKNRKGMKGLSEGDDLVGDYGTPEQQIPADGLPGVDWESCMTMNDNWGFTKRDENWKSSTVLVRQLIDIVSKGGNFLLNVGPTAEGLIPEPSIERLKDMGRWMKVNKDAIYGAGASPYKRAPAWGRVTQKPGKLFFHVFDWPKNGKLLVDVDAKKITAIYLLSDQQCSPLPIREKSGATEVTVPEKAPDAIASVVVVETSR